MIKEAWRVPGNYYYFLLTNKQARKVIFEGRTFAKDGRRRFLDMIPPQILKREPSKSTMDIELINGSIISISGVEGIGIGGELPDRFRGITPSGIVFSEYAMLKGDAVWKAFQPAIDGDNCWVIIPSTPKGKNHYKTLCDNVKDSDEWHFSEVHIDESEPERYEEILKSARISNKEEAWIQQEYYCSFTEAASGYVYMNNIKAAYDDKRIGFHPLNKNYPVDTGWDVGRSDGTAIWFSQKIDDKINIINFYMDAHKDPADYAVVLKNFGYQYGRHFFPHDATHVRMGAPTIQKCFEEAFTNFKVVGDLVSVDYGKVMPAVQIIKHKFPQISFHEMDTITGIRHLENYAEKINGEGFRTGSFVHDENSHPADAFRILVIGYEQDPFGASNDIYSEKFARKRCNRYNELYDPYGGF